MQYSMLSKIVLFFNVSYNWQNVCILNREKIHFETVIWHGPESKAEGWPAKIRVIAPKYVKYVEGQNDFESNYTVQSVSTDTVKLTSWYFFNRRKGGTREQ